MGGFKIIFLGGVGAHNLCCLFPFIAALYGDLEVCKASQKRSISLIQLFRLIPFEKNSKEIGGLFGKGQPAPCV